MKRRRRRPPLRESIERLAREHPDEKPEVLARRLLVRGFPEGDFAEWLAKKIRAAQKSQGEDG